MHAAGSILSKAIKEYTELQWAVLNVNLTEVKRHAAQPDFFRDIYHNTKQNTAFQIAANNFLLRGEFDDRRTLQKAIKIIKIFFDKLIESTELSSEAEPGGLDSDLVFYYYLSRVISKDSVTSAIQAFCDSISHTTQRADTEDRLSSYADTLLEKVALIKEQGHQASILFGRKRAKSLTTTLSPHSEC